MSHIFLPLCKCNRLFLIVAILGFSLIGPIVASCLPSPPAIDPSHVSRLSKFSLYLVALFLSPLIETVLFQSLPVLIISKFRTSEVLLLLAVVLPFSIAHFMLAAPFPSLVNGLIGGFSLGVCYIVFMQDSHRRAFFITAVVHSAHNAIVLGFPS